MAHPRVERLALGAVVLALHAALLIAWRVDSRRAGREAAPAQGPVTMLRLVPLPAPREAATIPPRPAPTAREPDRRVAAHVAPPQGQAVPQAITVLAGPSAEPAASAPPQRALDLSLPRAGTERAPRSLRDQVLDDPRANSPRPTVQSRVAAVAGTPGLVEQPMDATRMRIRQNGRCIEVHVARDAQINPWNQNHSPAPKTVRPAC